MITDHGKAREQHLPASSGVRIPASAMASVADGDDVGELRALNRNDMVTEGEGEDDPLLLFFECSLLVAAQ